MKWILGSGLAGLLTRHVLGPEYKIVPIGRSRFYSFMPALADNYLSQDPRYDDLIKQLEYDTSDINFYKKGYSVAGELLKTASDTINTDWIRKVFGICPPAHLQLILNKRLNFPVYGKVRLNRLYEKLQNMYMAEIKENLKFGELLKIQDHRLVFKTGPQDYTKIINTIPAPVIDKMCNLNIARNGTPVSFLHVNTQDLDFEGLNQIFVVDEGIPFFKCTKLDRTEYLFYFVGDIENNGIILMPYLRQYDIIDGTMINDYLPLDNLDHQTEYKALDIENIGTYARWDFAMDASSTLLHILRLPK